MTYYDGCLRVASFIPTFTCLNNTSSWTRVPAQVRTKIRPINVNNVCTACSIGTWILDAAASAPSTLFYGIDIEDRLLPEEKPSNVHFVKFSVTSLPREWTSEFNLVNQRLLVAALTEEEWRMALTEIFRVLVPGGYIQLLEAGPWKAGAVTARHLELVSAFFGTRGLLLDCVARLPLFLREAGFENIQLEERQMLLGAWGGRDGEHGRNNLMGVFR
jgi:ubiquinone/menaquinone biosynthesis C-methylase UbiE